MSSAIRFSGAWKEWRKDCEIFPNERVERLNGLGKTRSFFRVSIEMGDV